MEAELNSEEVADTENYLIRMDQKEVFKDEYLSLTKKKEIPSNSKLTHLYPRLDGDGVIRSDGQLTNAEFLPYNVRYPIIFPRKHWVAKLIVKHHHELGNHNSGTNQTLSSLSTRFWIIAAREEIIVWEKECMMCYRHKAKAAQQIMASLPLKRFSTPLKHLQKLL